MPHIAELLQKTDRACPRVVSIICIPAAPQDVQYRKFRLGPPQLFCVKSFAVAVRLSPFAFFAILKFFAARNMHNQDVRQLPRRARAPTDKPRRSRSTPPAAMTYYEDRAREWGNAKKQRGGQQKKQPEGDTGGWHPRTTDQPKFVYNTRRMWKHEIKRALQELDELPADAAHDVTDKAKCTLMAWFRRMCYLDEFNIIIQGTIGGSEERIYLNEAQIRRNNELREADNAPLFDLRAAPLPAYQDHHPSTTTKASSLTTPPPQLWSDVTESPPDVPFSPPPIWKVPQPPTPPSPSMQPSPAAPALHTGDTSSDEPYTPTEAPTHVEAVPHTGTIIAVAYAPLSAAPPPSRTTVLSPIPGETLQGAHTATLAHAVAQTVGNCIAAAVEARAKRMPLDRWSDYEKGRKRRRTATPVGPVMPIYEAHELHPSRVAEPVLKHSKLMVCDVVCCDVRPPDWYGPRCLDHMIHEIGTWTDGCTYRRIENNIKPPHMNGWCAAEHIYG